MIHCYRLTLSVMLLAGLAGCASTEELYARYDNQMCQVAQIPVNGMLWHTSVVFPYNKSEVAGSEELKLQENLTLLEKNPDYRVILRGFADSIASQRYNLPLSKRRANSIAQWLMSHGINQSRIDQTGLGKELLLISAVKGQDEETNRRVEMLLVDDTGRPVSLELPAKTAQDDTSKNRHVNGGAE